MASSPGLLQSKTNDIATLGFPTRVDTGDKVTFYGYYHAPIIGDIDPDNQNYSSFYKVFTYRYNSRDPRMPIPQYGAGDKPRSSEKITKVARR